MVNFEKWEAFFKEWDCWPKVQPAVAHAETLSAMLEKWQVTEDWAALWKQIREYAVFRRNLSSPQETITSKEFLEDLGQFFREVKAPQNAKERGVPILEAHQVRGASF